MTITAHVRRTGAGLAAGLVAAAMVAGCGAGSAGSTSLSGGATTGPLGGTGAGGVISVSVAPRTRTTRPSQVTTAASSPSTGSGGADRAANARYARDLDTLCASVSHGGGLRAAIASVSSGAVPSIDQVSQLAETLSSFGQKLESTAPPAAEPAAMRLRADVRSLLSAAGSAVEDLASGDESGLESDKRAAVSLVSKLGSDFEAVGATGCSAVR